MKNSKWILFALTLLSQPAFNSVAFAETRITCSNAEGNLVLSLSLDDSYFEINENRFSNGHIAGFSEAQSNDNLICTGKRVFDTNPSPSLPQCPVGKSYQVCGHIPMTGDFRYCCR